MVPGEMPQISTPRRRIWVTAGVTANSYIEELRPEPDHIVSITLGWRTREYNKLTPYY